MGAPAKRPASTKNMSEAVVPIDKKQMSLGLFGFGEAPSLTTYEWKWVKCSSTREFGIQTDTPTSWFSWLYCSQTGCVR